MSGSRVHALIPAAGQSVRFGGTTLKQYAHLLGLPVMAHSIEAVMAHAAVESVTVALASDDGMFEQLVQPLFPAVQNGGWREQPCPDRDERSANLSPANTRIVNGSWCMTPPGPVLHAADLDRLLEEGLESDAGAILAMPVSDTLKLADDSARIEQTD